MLTAPRTLVSALALLWACPALASTSHSGGAIQANSNILFGGGYIFSSGDVGQVVTIPGAGNGGALSAVIMQATGFGSAAYATLSAPAYNTVTQVVWTEGGKGGTQAFVTVAPSGGDDTPTLASLINSGTPVQLTAGTFQVTNLPILSGTTVVGAGQGVTILSESQPGSCQDVFTGQNAYSLFGTNTNGGINNFWLQGFTINGNNTTYGNCTSGYSNGVAVYGYHYVIRDVYVENVAGSGFRSGWYEYGGNSIGGTMETVLDNLTTDTVGQHGVWWAGPHDSITMKVTTIDSGQAADNTYYGFFKDTNGTITNYGFHGWHRSTVTNRVKFQAYDGGGDRWVDSDFEGGREEFFLASSTNSICSGCRFYAGQSSNGVLVEVGSAADLQYSPLDTAFTCSTTLTNYAIQFDSVVSGGSPIQIPCPSGEGAGAVDLQSVRFQNYEVAAGEGAALVGGLGNYAQGQSSAIVGGNQNWMQAESSGSVGGTFASDRAQTSQVFANGRFNTLGDSQVRTFVAHCSTSSSSCVMTPDASVTDGACIQIPNSTAYTLTIYAAAIDHTTPSNAYSWVLPNALLTQQGTAASTAVHAGTPLTTSIGTVSGLSFGVAADTTNGCLDINFTAPATSDTWDATARVITTETQ